MANDFAPVERLTADISTPDVLPFAESESGAMPRTVTVVADTMVNTACEP